MTTQECYEKFNGNYEDTLRRLTSDALVSRFLLKFPDDKSYSSLVESINAVDGPAAFTAAHTLKGVAMNLGLTSVYEPVHILTEALRNGWDDNAPALLVPVTEGYEKTLAAIQEYKESLA